MKVKDFFDLFRESLTEQKFEIYLNKDLVCCGYVSNIPMGKKHDILNAEIVCFDPTVNNTIQINAINWN